MKTLRLRSFVAICHVALALTALFVSLSFGVAHGVKASDSRPAAAPSVAMATTRPEARSYTYDAPSNGSTLTWRRGAESVTAKQSSSASAPGLPAAPADFVAAETGTGAFSRYAVDAAGNTTIRVRNANETSELTEHAAQRATQRGISIDSIENTVGGTGFRYYNRGADVYQTGYYDSTAKIFVGTSGGRVTTVIDRVNQNYINNLMNAGPP